MKCLAIVGTSHLSENEEMDARKRIWYEIGRYAYENATWEQIFSNIMVISGGAVGIDTLVEQICKEQGVEFLKKSPLKQGWNYYKIRNIQIARMADKVISISTAKKTVDCYHHINDKVKPREHERTGGCFVIKYAKNLGKKTELVII